ncbi:hypothetical protein E4U49_000279 [Claviceps purpurea]|nr:hypothetical protein E4U49_000279 [Claviceps purpurea]
MPRIKQASNKGQIQKAKLRNGWVDGLLAGISLASLSMHVTRVMDIIVDFEDDFV